MIVPRPLFNTTGSASFRRAPPSVQKAFVARCESRPRGPRKQVMSRLCQVGMPCSLPAAVCGGRRGRGLPTLQWEAILDFLDPCLWIAPYASAREGKECPQKR